MSVLFLSWLFFVFQPPDLPVDIRDALNDALRPGVRYDVVLSDGGILALESGLLSPDAEVVAWSATGLAMMLVRVGMAADALALLERAKTQFHATSQMRGAGFACMVRGYANYAEGDLAKSFTNLTEAATCFAQARDSNLVNWARADQIRVALDLGLKHTAADLMNDYERDRGSTEPDARLRASIGFSRARILATQGNLADAAATFEELLVLTRSVADIAAEAEISLMLSDLYVVMNRPRQSGEALKNYIRLNHASGERVKRVLNRDKLRDPTSLTTPSPASQSIGSKLLQLLPVANFLFLLPLLVAAWVFIFGRKRLQAPLVADRLEPQEAPLPEPEIDPEFEYNKLDLLFQRMTDLFENEALYRMQKLTLSDVAYRLGTNDKYVSQAVNTHVGEGFIHLVNEYRIRHAKQMLIKYGRRASSRRVAVESGFGSVSTFHRVFKTHTGLTPLEWIRTTRV